MDPTDPRQTVADGYDRMGARYAGLEVQDPGKVRGRYEATLLEELPPKARVLDLGCGAGVPTTRRLARRFAVTGVDISERQIDRARVNVPGAWFIHSDMAALDLPVGGFDGVSAFYSIIHLPRDEHAGLLRAISGWLVPGGLLIATMGTTSTAESYEDDWLGVRMYWSSFDGETNLRIVEEAGLRVTSAREETSQADDASETFLWIVARKPGPEL